MRVGRYIPYAYLSARTRRLVSFTRGWMPKCLACHLGSLYQHGGNRVDNVDLCVTCHNPAANEKNNRVNMGVVATEAYAGKVGESYDMRNRVHAIHSAGESGQPLVDYRSNGIYFFGSKAALAAATSWPSTGGVTCKNAENLDVTHYKVFGSVRNGTCNTTTGALSRPGRCAVGQPDRRRAHGAHHGLLHELPPVERRGDPVRPAHARVWPRLGAHGVPGRPYPQEVADQRRGRTSV